MEKIAINHERVAGMEIDLIATGKQLAATRRKHHLKQRELSALFREAYRSASVETICRWENGKKLISLENVVFLAELYDCRIDELVISSRRSSLMNAEAGDQPSLFYRDDMIRGVFVKSGCSFFASKKPETAQKRFPVQGNDIS